MKLLGRTAIVTGASQGMGFAIVEALLEEGASVATVSRSAGRLDEIKTGNGRLLRLTADIASERDVNLAVEQTISRFGSIDFLINNAGVSARAVKPLQENDVEESRRIIETNILGTFYMCHAVLPYMKEKDSGYIINILSTVAHNSSAGKSMYTASKFGLKGMTEALIKENKGTGIRVSSVSPGGTNTNIWNLKDVPPSEQTRQAMLQPEDVAEAVVFLLTRPRNVHIEDIRITPWSTGEFK